MAHAIVGLASQKRARQTAAGGPGKSCHCSLESKSSVEAEFLPPEGALVFSLNTFH